MYVFDGLVGNVRRTRPYHVRLRQFGGKRTLNPAIPRTRSRQTGSIGVQLNSQCPCCSSATTTRSGGFLLDLAGVESFADSLTGILNLSAPTIMEGS
jgi:hypothetical protein